MFSPPAKTRWVCRQCSKSLCSKRSYEEHMNIHDNRRPFKCGCNGCDYAAASQMTLTRHRQRKHMATEHWHYQCPYCAERYMEPASYKQHVLARHYGYSATFGCPYGDCPFTCKSSKAFRDHLQKHQAVILSRANGAASASPVQGMFDMDNLSLYMVDDSCGIGNVATMPSKFAIEYDRSALIGHHQQLQQLHHHHRPYLLHQQQVHPVQQQQQQQKGRRRREFVVFADDDVVDDDDDEEDSGNIVNCQPRQQQHREDDVMRINVDELLLDNDNTEMVLPSSLQLFPKAQHNNNNRTRNNGNTTRNDGEDDGSATTTTTTVFEHWQQNVQHHQFGHHDHRDHHDDDDDDNNCGGGVGREEVVVVVDVDVNDEQQQQTTTTHNHHNHHHHFVVGQQTHHNNNNNQQQLSAASADWAIETEVIIEDERTGAQQMMMPDGQTDDFGLD